MNTILNNDWLFAVTALGTGAVVAAILIAICVWWPR